MLFCICCCLSQGLQMENSSESDSLVQSNFSLINAPVDGPCQKKIKIKKLKQAKLNASSPAQHSQRSMFGPSSRSCVSVHLSTTSCCFISEKLCSGCLDGGEAESSCVMMADRLSVGCSLARALSPQPIILEQKGGRWRPCICAPQKQASAQRAQVASWSEFTCGSWRRPCGGLVGWRQCAATLPVFARSRAHMRSSGCRWAPGSDVRQRRSASARARLLF